MSELTCAEAREAAAEAALGILEEPARSPMAAHVEGCPSCRYELDSLSAVGRRLLELVPGTEPPLGFDHRVMQRVRGNRRRRPTGSALLGAAAAALAVLFGSIGWMAGRSSGHHPETAELTAAFHQGNRDIGRVSLYQSRNAWVSITLHGSATDGMVTCELMNAGGTVTRMGSFELVGGSGSWSAPDPHGTAGVRGAMLVDSHGQVVATALFH